MFWSYFLRNRSVHNVLQHAFLDLYFKKTSQKAHLFIETVDCLTLNNFTCAPMLIEKQQVINHYMKSTLEEFVGLHKNSRGRRCLSSSQLLALITVKAGSGRALFWAAPKNTLKGGGQKGWDSWTGRRSDRWDRGVAARSNLKGVFFIFFLFFPLLSFIVRTSPLICKSRRCPSPHLVYSNGPSCGWHLWLLWWCSLYSLPPILLLPPPQHTTDPQPVESDRASWRGRWFCWMSTLAARSEF